MNHASTSNDDARRRRRGASGAKQALCYFWILLSAYLMYLFYTWKNS